jgi:hypothetical protein
MAYPNELIAQLISINGSSCGTLTGRCAMVASSNPPEYREVAGGGDFQYIRCWRTTVGGNTTWNLKFRYTGAGSCNGLHTFQLSTAADNPVGAYCYLSGGVISCSAGEAATVDND